MKTEEVFIIAEIGGNHEGDINKARELMHLAIESGADSIKFQVYSGDTLVNIKEDPKRVRHFDRFSFTDVQYINLAKECISLGADFNASIWNERQIDLLDPFLSFYKIGSGDIVWDAMIEKIASKNKPVLVPPSVIVPGAIAASDRIAAEWFAPAGLNRGVLGNVIEAKMRLNQAERDRLYNAKINPIATFPQTGVCIWGQKTLQEKSSALDRINVRRLLIALKKFIASSSRYLVFEQNTNATRNRFLNIVNPYLEGVQQKQGLYAFRVQMDENNNTADVIDRNQLVGAIYLQPTKTAEFIVLDFNVLPTGATFE